MYQDDEVYKFKATITYCRYYNEESSWGVYNFATNDEIPHYLKETSSTDFFDDDTSVAKKNNTTRKLSTLSGKMQELVVGGEYIVRATFKQDKKYGDQYVPIAVYAIVPQDHDTQLLFLKSLVSETVAENLLNAYPNIVNDVVSGVLKEINYEQVKGVREATWAKIKEKIINNYLVSDIIVMLKPLGVTYTMIKKLLNNEPNPVLLKQQIEENPYILCKIKGLGFKRVDEMALKLKPKLIDSIERLVAFTKYYLTELGENDGHTWCSKNILKNAITNYIPECNKHVDWFFENNDMLHIEGDKVGLQHYYDIEARIYHLIWEKIKHDTSVNISDENIDLAIKLAEKEQGFEYMPEQLEAIKSSLKRPFSIITGKAGTGKSSILRAIIKAYTENKYTVTASALSAMAAQRITEATSFPAMTIHRTLGSVGLNKFTFDKDNSMPTDVAFLDEGSMVNASLFLHWLEAIGSNTRIIISGDHKQLPPIGYGNVFSDLIEILPKAVVSKLVKPMRQAEKSGILVDANKVRENINPIKEKIEPRLIHGELKDMYYMFRPNRQSLFNIAIKTYFKSIETEGLDNVAIVVPRRKDCINSTAELNKVIQEKLLGNISKQIAGTDITFKLGAKIMQTVNDYEKNVFNGEFGYITKIDTRKNGNKTEEYCEATFTDSEGHEKIISYTKNELNSLDLAYAITCHKMQGGSRKTIIGIIDNTHFQLLDNCLLYTLLTRAKSRCLLLAEPQAFIKCIRTSNNRRQTWMSLRNTKQLNLTRSW